jgi:hypothetical protein
MELLFNKSCIKIQLLAIRKVLLNFANALISGTSRYNQRPKAYAQFK